MLKLILGFYCVSVYQGSAQPFLSGQWGDWWQDFPVSVQNKANYAIWTHSTLWLFRHQVLRLEHDPSCFWFFMSREQPSVTWTVLLDSVCWYECFNTCDPEGGPGRTPRDEEPGLQLCLVRFVGKAVKLPEPGAHVHRPSCCHACVDFLLNNSLSSVYISPV